MLFLSQAYPVNEGIFAGPQMRKNEKYNQTLGHVEMAVWRSFKTIIFEFLGNRTTETYKNLVKELFEQY